MTDERLTDELAARGMGWRPAPDRYPKPGRSWIPKWRFQPLNKVADAFELLNHAAHKYALSGGQNGVFTARVEIGDRTGEVSGESKARTIGLAVARALGIDREANS
jgi:hypothetical protein